MYDDLAMLGIMLDDDDGDDIMGLTAAQIERRGRVLRRQRRTRVQRRQRVLQAAKAALVPSIPGAPGNALRGFALGFPVAIFVAGGPTTIEVQAEPQLAFKGARLVIETARAGASSTALVSITTFLVGQRDQRVSGDGLLAGAFAANAFQTVLALDQATPGINLRLGFTIIGAALAGGDTITVGSQIIGATIA